MFRRFCLIALAAAAGLASPALGADDTAEKEKQISRKEAPGEPRMQDASLPVYKPPMRGAPGGRIGGGTRSGTRETLALSVLAPDHTGLTMDAQPALYWMMSAKTALPVEITVVDPRATKPLMELKLSGPIEAGVHAVRLAEHNVRLEPGVAYRWFVAIVQDPARRSRDLLTGGSIERVDLSAAVRTRLASAHPAERPSLLAQAGLWYDALAAVCHLIEASPADAKLLRHRAALLAQVGLQELSSP